jgi:hypothetical protein
LDDSTEDDSRRGFLEVTTETGSGRSGRARSFHPALRPRLVRQVDRRHRADAGADRLNATQAALECGRSAIERIPTWPWRPETLRSVTAALILPVVIWLVQTGVQKLLG